jgi:NADPH:quinone reductase-like Zn-dependent oxidoreductase
MAFLLSTGLRPKIDRTLPLTEIGQGLAAMQAGELLGKIVIEP